MENLLDEVNITCNKNAIPNDPQSPFVTSGTSWNSSSYFTRHETGRYGQDRRSNCYDLKEEGSQEKAKAIVKELTDKYPLVG